MGAEYLSYVKSIATFAHTFYGYIVSVLAGVFGFKYSEYSKCSLLNNVNCQNNLLSTLFSEKDVFQRPAGEAKVQNYFFGEWQDREK